MFGRVYYLDILNKELDIDNIDNINKDDIKIYCAIFGDYINRKTIKKITITLVETLELEFININQIKKHARFICKKIDDELQRQKKEQEEFNKEFNKLWNSNINFDIIYQSKEESEPYLPNYGICKECGESVNKCLISQETNLCNECSKIYRKKRHKLKKKEKKEKLINII